RIENINGVGQVQIVGGAEREVQVKVDPDKMRAFNVTVAEVVAAVRQQNLEVPGGRVDEGTRELTVRTMGRIASPADFNNIAVAQRGAYVVKVSDIGYVEDGAVEQRTAALLNGQPAVTLVVSKQSGENTVAVADAVKERLEEIRATLPKDVRAEIVGDQSVFIKAALDSIETHLVEGGLLAALVVFVFLWNVRSTLIAAIAIPTSIIATFGLMKAMDYTLNQITMLALTLMVGIVIDDAIVVLENLYRYIEEKGYSPFQAAIEGTKEIGLAVMATTLSLLAVFLPVGFMGGIVGRFMSSFGFTSSFAIAVSLLVSFTLTPMLSARLIKRREEEHAVAEEASNDAQVRGVSVGEDDGATPEGMGTAPPPSHDEARRARTAKESRFYRPIDRTYTKLLEWSMRHRWAVVGACVVAVLSIVPLFMVIGKNFLPVDDQSQFEVTLRAPEGSTLASTQALTERIARDMRTLPGVTDTLATIGGGQQELVNSASIYVRLTPIEERERTQEELMQDARQLLDKYPKDLRTSVGQV
ncbi:MAG TPA: efflux RND transporter permease subunit, partial [Pyrinomonadaceae bacterium]|nr:efflux RND transporter permease subunit [Pyrinomonadaceae bacterium]